MFSHRTEPFGRPAIIALACITAYGAVFAASWPVTEMNQRLLAVMLAVPLIWLSVVDMRSFVIPDFATGLVAMVGLIRLATDDHGAAFAIEIIGAIMILGLFWLVGEICWRKSGREALGIGDAKLMAAGALCVGIAQFWLVLLLASIGGIMALVLSRRAATGMRQGVAFGPFLAFAIFLVFLTGEF
jgi:prepilin signal peptidase PulO-like enzyme (type II secretory pathway)